MGKSTLVNALVGLDLSIATPKAQTTQHRILAINSTNTHQIVFVDTPGLLLPKDLLQAHMLSEIQRAMDGVDLVLWLVEAGHIFGEEEQNMVKKLRAKGTKSVWVLNKADTLTTKEIQREKALWEERKQEEDTFFVISATRGTGMLELKQHIQAQLPEHPAYYPEDQLSDKQERFFAEETIRKHLFFLYEEEVPYDCAVEVLTFKTQERLLRVEAVVYVARESQKGILIGRKGQALKKLGTSARKDMEVFFGQKVYLGLQAKVVPNWKRKKEGLHQVGFLRHRG